MYEPTFFIMMAVDILEWNRHHTTQLDLDNDYSIPRNIPCFSQNKTTVRFFVILFYNMHATANTSNIEAIKQKKIATNGYLRKREQANYSDSMHKHMSFGSFNIKSVFHVHGAPLYKDKTVARPCYFRNGNHYS